MPDVLLISWLQKLTFKLNLNSIYIFFSGYLYIKVRKNSGKEKSVRRKSIQKSIPNMLNR